MKKRKLTLLIFTLISWSLFGQDSWSLEHCIQLALENNNQIKTAQYNLQQSKLDAKEATNERLPGISGDFRGGYQFGRTIDPTTNTFDNKRIGYNIYGVQASIDVFTGLRIKNKITQSQYNSTVAKLEVDAEKNNVILQVTEAYLNALLAEEQLQIVKKSLAQSEDQLKNVEQKIAVGVMHKNGQLEFSSIVQKNQKDLIVAKNELTINHLILKQLLEIDSDTELTLDRFYFGEFLPPAPNLSVSNLYEKALKTQPQIRANELRLKSAETGVNIAKSSYFPTVSLFGTLSTNFSTEGKKLDQLESVPVAQDGFINGEPVLLEFEQTVPRLMDVPYSDQLEDNFGQGLGVLINIPIFNKGKNKLSVERARINLLQAREQAKQNDRDLKMQVVRAYTDMVLAWETYLAAKKSAATAQLAYEDIQKRFELGVSSTFELTTAQNNADTEQFDLARSKFQYLFSKKVVEHYQGK